MSSLPVANNLVENSRGPADYITLDYEARLLRRRRLTSTGGLAFLVDLPEARSVAPGEAFELDDGRLIAIIAADEPLVEARGALAMLAWHIGNRHTPCQICDDKLVLRQDPVLEDMLKTLGAELVRITGPFTPHGGAYGHGRVMGHDHGHAHSHADG
ncbi:MAG: urease accessory protein UreE [Rhodobacteraceae bacterium]|nr:urease accessory protein UreE [Paracoccaceae bacterium]